MTKKETKNINEMNIYEKINKMKEDIREHDFVMDKVLPSNLGSAEYASIAQYYTILQKTSIDYNVFFKWDVMEELDFERNVFQPTGKLPQHLHTVSCTATFINIDNPEEVVEYISIASGSDTCDKGVSGASTLAFRNWFDKNFTPKYLNQGGEEIIAVDEEKTEAPKIPTYIPPQKKEEIKEEVVSTKQNSDDEDIKRVIDKIMKIRDIGPKKDYGSSTLDAIMRGETNASDLLAIELKLDNKLDELGGNE